MHEDVDRALRMVREAKELVYDTETSGVDWKRNFPIGYVIGDGPRDVVYIPVRHGGGGNLPGVPLPNSATDEIVIHPFEKELAKAFEQRTGITIGHNLKFDCHFSANAGIMLGRNLSCTQNNEALLNEYSRSFSLDSVAKEHGVTAKLGGELYQHLATQFGCKADRKAMAHYWELPGDDPIATDYAIGDGVTTIELYHKQVQDITSEGLDQIFELENALIWTLFRMERRGIRVDEEYLHWLREEIERRVASAYDALPPDFNVRSPNHVREYVESAGHSDWPTTDKGNPSFTESWLKEFPEGQNIVAVRKWSNLNNSFVTPLIEEHVWNGRVHPNLNQMKSDDYGTISGRFSCSQPNLQQIPKRDKELAALFRKGYLADDGYLFYERDYSQCEPRLFGHYSGEPAIVNGYNSDPPKDMHAVVAELLGVERDPTAKRMNMGIMTGMFPKSFSGHMGWDMEMATDKWNQWFEAFPAIRDFQEKAKAVLQSRGYVVTILGRRCRLEKPQLAYRAVSKIIQGGNADILKYFLLKLDKLVEEAGDTVHLLMTVHDAYQWQAPDTPEGREISAEMDREMVRVQEEPFNLRVPFAVEGLEGKNWAEATFGPEAV